MKSRFPIAALAACIVLGAAGAAYARNPHCAGGIQYVVQGLRDKEKGNTEDYSREMNKAVDQLTQCASEDPADLEAMGYLGWAYAELDSMGPAGQWFTKAIDGLKAKGDVKKLDIVVTNRESYWARTYNDGIKAIGDAQNAWPDYGKEPSADEKALKDQATKSYAMALDKLTKAKLLKPEHAQTIRNLATAYALMGRFDDAEAVLKNGLTEAAQDTAAHQLAEALRTVRANKAGALLDAKKFDQAIAYYTELTKGEPTNSDHWMGLGNALFSRAQTRQDADRRADFKASGDAYSKAFSLAPANADLGFNAALAYQNAGELASAEAAWRAVLKAKPGDPDALSSLGSTLADMQKFDEAIQVLHQAIDAKPDNKAYYRQLGAAYSKAGNNPKSAELLTIYLAMNSGTAAADPATVAKAAKAGSPAANTLASLGAPSVVYDWTADNRKLQTWLYPARRQGFTFDSGAGMTLVQKSDWSSAAPTGGKK